MRCSFKIMLVSITIAALYLGWTFYSRWRDNRAFISKLEQTKAEQNRPFLEAYEGGIKIMGFYATPGVITRGKKAQLCYSVVNCERVRIEPPVGDVWPSRSRCVDVSPKSDTTYKLIAEDAEGNVKTTSVTVQVR